MSLLLLLLAQGAAPGPVVTVDTHDGGAQVYEMARQRESRRVIKTDETVEIAAEMRAALAPKTQPPQTKAEQVATAIPQTDEEEEELLCLFMI